MEEIKRIIIVPLLCCLLLITGCSQIKNQTNPINQEENESEVNTINQQKINLTINNTVLSATLVESTTTNALIEKLNEGPITIDMSDYGNFEKVGSLGFNLVTNDERITTSAGDLILYQGNQFVIYYDTNTYSFTRLGKIDNLNSSELRNILGEDNIQVTISLIK